MSTLLRNFKVIDKIIQINQNLFEGFDCDKVLTGAPIKEVVKLKLLIEKSTFKIKKLESLKKNKSNELQILLSVKEFLLHETNIIESIKAIRELETATPLPIKKLVKKEVTEQQIKTALSYIEFMEGVNRKGELIMKTEEYKRLVSYVTQLIQNEEIPEDIKKISKIGVTKEFIQHTFYLMHKKLYGTRPIRDYFVQFLHQVFSQFDNSHWKDTTKSKWSKAPDHYYNDIEEMKSNKENSET